MQIIDLDLSKDLSEAFFNPRASSLFRDTSREGLLNYAALAARLERARAGIGATLDGREKTEPKRGHRNGRPGEYGPRVSDANSLPDQIERIPHALTAAELAQLLAVSRITLFKLAKAGRIPAFRIGTCVRFDPRAVANWLRQM
jgi:excisionase family DNA binding protein